MIEKHFTVELRVRLTNVRAKSAERAEARAREILVRQGITPLPGATTHQDDQPPIFGSVVPDPTTS